MKHEIDLAEHFVPSGRVRKVLVFILDDITREALPKWLRRYVYRRETSPTLIANIIRSYLIEIDVEDRAESDIFLGRDEELQSLKAAISRPSTRAPTAIYISGWEGIGRRTLARRALRDTLPWMTRIPPEIPLLDFEGAPEFYRRPLDFIELRTPTQWQELITEFNALDPDEQAKKIAAEIRSLVERKQVVFVRGHGAIVGDTGNLQGWLSAVLEYSSHENVPALVIISRRAVPFARRQTYPRVYFVSLRSLPLDVTSSVLNLWLKRYGLTVSQGFLDEIAPFLGGHPRSIQVAAEFAREFTPTRLLEDKVQCREVVRERSTELLRLIPLDDLQKKIIFGDYHYLDLEELLLALGTEEDNRHVEAAIRYLEDHGIVEWEAKYFRLAPYLSDAVNQFAWGATLKKFRTEAAARLIERLKELETTDLVKVSAIDAALLSAIRSGKIADARWIGHFLLPSHLLRVATEEYNARRHRAALQLCQQALESGYALTPDAEIEGWRLAGMSAARLGDDRAFERAVRELGRFRTNVANRNRCFIRGFRERVTGHADRAEEWYRKALEIDHRNFHVLRELAQVLCAQERYDEAELYARDAYGRAPTNPYVIDNLLEVIIGRATRAQLDGNDEVEELFDELRDQDARAGTHFFEQRLARYYSKVGLWERALEYANEAVRETPNLFSVYVTRARVKLELGHVSEIREDIEEMERITADATTGEGKSNRFLLTDVRVRYHLARGEAEVARTVLNRFAGTTPRHVRERLAQEITARGH